MVITADMFFHISPKGFDQVFIGRIWGQPQHLKAIESGYLGQGGFSVKFRVVHDNHTPRFQPWAKVPFKPCFKPLRVCTPVVYVWGYYFAAALRCHYVDSLVPLAGPRDCNRLTARGTHIGTTQIPVNPAFVQINDRNMPRQRCYLPVKFRPLVFVPLGIRYRPFFKVIFSRARALAAPITEPPKCSAISRKYACGCSLTKMRNLSESYTQPSRFGTLIRSPPVSTKSFFHPLIAVVPTLNTLLASACVCPSVKYPSTLSLKSILYAIHDIISYLMDYCKS